MKYILIKVTDEDDAEAANTIEEALYKAMKKGHVSEYSLKHKIPATVLETIPDLGVGDIYTDADEYAERVDMLAEACGVFAAYVEVENPIEVDDDGTVLDISKELLE